MLLVTARPHVERPWDDAEHVSQLKLERLNRDDSADLVSRIVGSIEIPVDLQQQILDKSDGVPLYLEEITKHI